MPCIAEVPRTADTRPGKPLQLITTLYKLASNGFTLPWTLMLSSTGVL